MSDEAGEQAREDAIRQMFKSARTREDQECRVPTAAEAQALQSRFGLLHIPTYTIRTDLAQATTFYYHYSTPPTPNAQDDRLRDIQKKTNALINALGSEVLSVVIAGKGVSFPEPPGLRRMLYQLRGNVRGEIEAIEPYVNHSKKQTQGWKKGLRPFIFYLHQKVALYIGYAPRAFSRSGSFYKSAYFFNFIIEACRLCGICRHQGEPISETTIGEEIRRLVEEGVIPMGEKRVKNPNNRQNLTSF